MIMETSVRQEKEEFVTNLVGCRFLDLLGCALLAPVLLLFLKCVQSRSKPSLAVEYIVLVLPSLLSVTLFALDKAVNLYVLVLCMLGCFVCIKRTNVDVVFDAGVTTDSSVRSRLAYVSAFKGKMFISKTPALWFC
jgi:hypothetical protein